MTDGAPQPDQDRDGIAQPGRFYRSAAIFYFLLAAAAVVWIGLDRGTVALDLFVLPGRLAGDLAAGLGAGALLVAGTWIGRSWPPLRELEERLRALLGAVTRTEAIALALISGFAEELFFRGAVQGSWGWLWATVLFALMHMGPERPIGWWTAFALVAGGLFAALTLFRGTLLPAMLAHATVNAVGLLRLTGDPAPGERGS